MIVLLIVLALLFLPAAFSSPQSRQRQTRLVFATCAALISSASEIFGLDASRNQEPPGCHRNRKRRSVRSVHHELGPYYVRRAYRMTSASFWRLCTLLAPYIKTKVKKKFGRPGAKNGLIPISSRVSSALRYFAGGSTYDISVVHGIGVTDVFRSVWQVVDAVNACPQLAFSYPSDHAQQQEIADGFKSVSRGIFDCCSGAVDGILIWTEQPSERNCEIAGCQARKFFCGRKKKFGLNMQATCDHEN